jgi:Zn-dependent protease
MLKTLLLLLHAAKLGKILLTSGTMLISVIAYSWLFGWWYAVGFVALIFVHEMGHYVAARRRGLDVGAPTFIPFVGAWIQLKEMPHNAETEAYVGIAGPLAGTLGALGCFYLSRYYDNQLLLALAYAGCFINLFNLIPLRPFDGGRITAVISSKVWWLGAPVFVAIFLYRPSPLLVLIALLALPQVLASIRGTEPVAEGYYVATAEARFTYALLYLGLAAFLAIMCYDLSLELPGH